VHDLLGTLGDGDDIGPHQVGEFRFGQPSLEALGKRGSIQDPALAKLAAQKGRQILRDFVFQHVTIKAIEPNQHQGSDRCQPNAVRPRFGFVQAQRRGAWGASLDERLEDRVGGVLGELDVQPGPDVVRQAQAGAVFVGVHRPQLQRKLMRPRVGEPRKLPSERPVAAD
jgi:hypothetical protein